MCLCTQDTLPAIPEGGAPAAEVSQYACQRRTTTDNYNVIFTVRSSSFTSSLNLCSTYGPPEGG